MYFLHGSTGMGSLSGTISRTIQGCKRDPRVHSQNPQFEGPPIRLTLTVADWGLRELGVSFRGTYSKD